MYSRVQFMPIPVRWTYDIVYSQVVVQLVHQIPAIFAGLGP